MAEDEEKFIVHVYSLDAAERQTMASLLEHRLGNVAVSQLPLFRSELRGIKLKKYGKPHMIVLCHYNEGRVLLTDRDGLYNDFIIEAVSAASGNVVVALTPVPTALHAIAHAETVAVLAQSGGQRGILTLHAQKRFLTWEDQPSDTQMALLEAALLGHLPALQVPSSVMDYATRRRAARSGFCDIL